MGNDNTKIALCAFGTGLSGVGLYFVQKHLKSLQEKQEKIIKQRNVHTPISLLQKKEELKKGGEQYMMVTGTVLGRTDKASLQEHGTIDQFYKIHPKKEMYLVEYEVSLGNDRTQTWYKSNPKKGKFSLIDPLMPTDAHIVVEPGNEAYSHNAYQKRKFLKGDYDYNKKEIKFFEKLSLITYEGSSVTLLGMVGYDSKSDTIKMTKLTGLITGGLKECSRFLHKLIHNALIQLLYIYVINYSTILSQILITIIFGLLQYLLLIGRGVMVFLTGLLGFITVFCLYSKFNYHEYQIKNKTYQQLQVNEYMINSRVLKEREKVYAELNNIQRMPSAIVKEQGVYCSICMVNPSDVITIPCNHLSITIVQQLSNSVPFLIRMCRACFQDLKTRYQNGEQSKFDCLICRAPIEADNHIIINYKPIEIPPNGPQNQGEQVQQI